VSRQSELQAALDRFAARPRPLPLRGAVQHFDWGGYTYIPSILGIDNREQKPYAELWLGAHPRGPAQVAIEGHPLGLDRLLLASGPAVLGRSVGASNRGDLPFLMKVLDVRSSLSIQAHPSRAQARAGYAREEARGLALDDPRRNYPDPNHKPEAHVALTDFYMLHGFSPLAEIGERLARVPELRSLARVGGGGLRALYSQVMTAAQDVIDGHLKPLIERLGPSYDAGELERSHAEYWLVRAAREHPLPGGHLDRGLISFFLLNLVHLKPGEGTYQGPGVAHAYLEGVTIEVMASSDNVLRGGLTPKQVDVDELLRTLTFDSGVVHILAGEQLTPTEWIYRTPAEEFCLSRIELARGRSHAGAAGSGPACLIVTRGEARVACEGDVITLPRGTCVLVPGDLPFALESDTTAEIHQARVPD
jgi:mannose-6-phosphate isomerase